MKESYKTEFLDRKARVITRRRMRAEVEYFHEILEFSLQDNEKYAWRAAYTLQKIYRKNDERIRPHLLNIIKAIEGKSDGHQRELLKLTRKMKVDEDEEGFLFDVCIGLWENPNKQPSVRIWAFRLFYGIAQKHPELLEEIQFLLEPTYTDSLTPGVKRSFEKIVGR